MIRNFRKILAVAGISLFGVLATPVLAQVSENPEQDCVGADPDLLIAGCSTIIETRMLFGSPITPSDLAVAYNNRGNAYRQSQQMDKALADLNEAIRLAPEYATAYYNRGLTYQLSNRYEEAVADYSRSLELEPGSIDALNNRGNTYRLLRQYDKALADLNFNLEQDPRHLPSLYNRALVYEETGRIDLARLDYRKVVKIDPDFEDARERFANL